MQYPDTVLYYGTVSIGFWNLESYCLYQVALRDVDLMENLVHSVIGLNVWWHAERFHYTVLYSTGIIYIGLITQVRIISTEVICHLVYRTPWKLYRVNIQHA